MDFRKPDKVYEQLVNFLTNYASKCLDKKGEIKLYIKRYITSLQRDLRSGKKKVCSPDDIYPKPFSQQYIYNAFVVHSDKVMWDGETKVKRKDDWHSCWSTRRIHTLRCVFEERPLHVVLTSFFSP